MTNTLGVKAWATGAAALVAVTACAGPNSDADPPPSPSISSSVPSTASPTPSPSSDTDLASAAAEEVVRRYFTVLDDLRQNPTQTVKSLRSVATSTQLTAQERLLTSERRKGLHQLGKTAIVELTVQSVNLDNSDPSAGKVPTVTIDVCWDVGDVDIVDDRGTSAVSPDRASTGWTRYTVANYVWSEDPSGGWRIATGHDLKQTPCSAS